MGREFPYTPEGMAAAQQYRQAIGMRDGGMMGFRPIGMQAGGIANSGMAPEVMAIFQGLVDVTQSGSTQDVAAYIEANRQGLNDIASILPPGQASFVQNTLDSFAPPPVQQMKAPPDVSYGMSDPGAQFDVPPPGPPPFSGGVEGGDQYLLPGAQPPSPYDSNEIEVANGGYITRNMNRGGLMSLRRR
tara:strand:+ start:145 stop:708 length:564 start_codon:yes stop_codon:yes gene_type:complete